MNTSHSFGAQDNEPGVEGTSKGNAGLSGLSEESDGIRGRAGANNAAGARGTFVDPAVPLQPPGRLGLKPPVRPGCGVLGIHHGLEGTDGYGVRGESTTGDGVWGTTGTAEKTGVYGQNTSTEQFKGNVAGGNGVLGVSSVPNGSGVCGIHNRGGVGVTGFSEDGVGVQGGGAKAGLFHGPVEVNGAGLFQGPVEVNGDVTIKGELFIGSVEPLPAGLKLNRVEDFITNLNSASFPALVLSARINAVGANIPPPPPPR